MGMSRIATVKKPYYCSMACNFVGTWQIRNIDVDVVLGTALVNTYAKCGCVETAMQAFRELPYHDVMTWAAMIGGLAMGGHGEEALELFTEMCKGRGLDLMQLPSSAS
ncbi:hypothetical protein Taro_037709 [Colocasia esculenta]|uniref:Pentatricopeptide repeat-containing protein n=1 Tax=Colocasia esculenta TaxID=4460 RepID=A0A843WQH4_COLES|nr:hypothetical protein [Colocasia esculenta]